MHAIFFYRRVQEIIKLDKASCMTGPAGSDPAVNLVGGRVVASGSVPTTQVAACQLNTVVETALVCLVTATGPAEGLDARNHQLDHRGEIGVHRVLVMGRRGWSMGLMRVVRVIDYSMEKRLRGKVEVREGVRGH